MPVPTHLRKYLEGTGREGRRGTPPRGNEGKSDFFFFSSFLFLLLDKPSTFPPFPFASVKLVFPGESVLLDIITRFRG